MASIPTLTKTFLLLILSTALPLSAHVLPAENTSPERIFERSSSAGTNFRFKFEHPNGTPLSEELASKINVYHHHMNVSAGIGQHGLNKRQTSRRIDSCRPSPYAGGTMAFQQSFCSPESGPKEYIMACDHSYPLYGRTQTDHTVIIGSCLPSEICVDYQLHPANPVAFCVSHEAFVKVATTQADQNKNELLGVHGNNPHTQVQMRVTNHDNTAWEKQHLIELDALKCNLKSRAVDCDTLTIQSCVGCYGRTLVPLDINTNTISTRVVFNEPSVNVFISAMSA